MCQKILMQKQRRSQSIWTFIRAAKMFWVFSWCRLLEAFHTVNTTLTLFQLHCSTVWASRLNPAISIFNIFPDRNQQKLQMRRQMRTHRLSNHRGGQKIHNYYHSVVMSVPASAWAGRSASVFGLVDGFTPSEERQAPARALPWESLYLGAAGSRAVRV